MIDKHEEIGLYLLLLPPILQIGFMACACCFFKAFITPLHKQKHVKDVLERFRIIVIKKKVLNDSLLCQTPLSWVQVFMGQAMTQSMWKGLWRSGSLVCVEGRVC